MMGNDGNERNEGIAKRNKWYEAEVKKNKGIKE
jgi:hypothetical protein